MSLLNDYLKKTQEKTGIDKEALLAPPLLARSSGRLLPKPEFRIRTAVLIVLALLAAGWLIFPGQGRAIFTQYDGQAGADQLDSRTNRIQEQLTASEKTDYQPPALNNILPVPKRAAESLGLMNSDRNVKSDSKRVSEGPATQANSGFELPCFLGQNSKPKAQKRVSVAPATQVNSGFELSSFSGQNSKPKAPKQSSRFGQMLAEEQWSMSNREFEDPYQDLVDESYDHDHSNYVSASIRISSRKNVNNHSGSKPRRSRPNISGFQSGHYYLQGLKAQKEGRSKEAIKLYQTGLKKTPNDIRLLGNLAALYLQQGRWESAEPLLEKALAVAPDDDKLLVNLGLVRLAQKDYLEAEKYFKEALTRNPMQVTALHNLAYLAQESDRFQDMDQYYKKLIDLAQDKAEIMLSYASLLEKSGQYRQAVAMYRQAIRQEELSRKPALKMAIRRRVQLLARYQ